MFTIPFLEIYLKKNNLTGLLKCAYVLPGANSYFVRPEMYTFGKGAL